MKPFLYQFQAAALHMTKVEIILNIKIKRQCFRKTRKIICDLPSKPSDEAPFGFPPRPRGILLLLSLSEAFLSDLSFLSFDPKIDSLEDLVGVSVFPTEFTDVSFSTLPFSLSFKLLPPSVVSLPPPTPSLGGASSSRDFKESPAKRKKINAF